MSNQLPPSPATRSPLGRTEWLILIAFVLVAAYAIYTLITTNVPPLGASAGTATEPPICWIDRPASPA